MSFRKAAEAIRAHMDPSWDPAAGEFVADDELMGLLRDIFTELFEVTVVITAPDVMGCDDYTVLKSYSFIDADEATAFRDKILAGDHEFVVEAGGSIKVYGSSRKLYPHHYTELDTTTRKGHDKS